MEGLESQTREVEAMRNLQQLEAASVCKAEGVGSLFETQDTGPPSKRWNVMGLSSRNPSHGEGTALAGDATRSREGGREIHWLLPSSYLHLPSVPAIGQMQTVANWEMQPEGFSPLISFLTPMIQNGSEKSKEWTWGHTGKYRQTKMHICSFY